MEVDMLTTIAQGLTIGGAACAFGLGGMGSAKGIAIASQQAAGVLREKPELFGQLLVMIALPGTQGFYGFIIAIMMATQTGVFAGDIKITAAKGIALFFVGLFAGLVQYLSAVKQGEASAAGISLVGRRPEESGRAIMFPALVETYAVVALLAAILFIVFLTRTSGAAA
jgi:V/A-type H+-transporting ATPase subunit K